MRGFGVIGIPLMSVLILFVIVFNIISVGWWCFLFYGFMTHPDFPYMMMRESNPLIAEGEFLITLVTLIADVIFLLFYMGRLRSGGGRL